jgi:sulfofructose kinase
MRPGVERLLPLCDIILASKKGASGAFPAAATSPERQVQGFLDIGAAIAGVTLGKHGAVIGTRTETGTTIRTLPAIPAPDAIDSCGAGDVFHGAFLWAYLQGRDPIACAHFAQAAASLRIRRLGNRAGVPTLAEVEMLLAP